MRLLLLVCFLLFPSFASAQLFESWAHEAGGGPQWFKDVEAGKEKMPRFQGRACSFLHAEFTSVKEGKRVVLYLRLSKMMATFRVYAPEDGTVGRSSHKSAYVHESVHADQAVRGYGKYMDTIGAEAIDKGFLWKKAQDQAVVWEARSHAENKSKAEEFAQIMNDHKATCEWETNGDWVNWLGAQQWMLNHPVFKDILAHRPAMANFTDEAEAYWTSWYAIYVRKLIERYKQDKQRYGMNAAHRKAVQGYFNRANMHNWHNEPGRWELYYSDSHSNGHLLHKPIKREVIKVGGLIKLKERERPSDSDEETEEEEVIIKKVKVKVRKPVVEDKENPLTEDETGGDQTR